MVVTFLRSGLYPALGMNRVEELRRLVTSISFAFLILIGFTFGLKTSAIYSRLALVIMWGLCLVFIPAFRVLMRWWLTHLKLWGEPVVIIGDIYKALPLANYFRRNPHFGIRPLAVLRDELCISDDFKSYKPMPIEKIGAYVRSRGLGTALIVTDDLEDYDDVVIRYRNIFHRVILIRYQRERYVLNNLKPLDFADVLGLQVKHNLLNPFSQVVKRFTDLLGATLGLLLLSPFLALISLLIALESPGGVVYRQPRLGRGGSTFHLLKFRSMRKDADQVLAGKLATDPELKKEWERFEKLKRDPRITRVGRLLRKFSLDELPQLWNVLMGKMSLVGPRPMMLNQRQKYGQPYSDYVQVTPGMTGLWQISGRNQTTFRRRAALDSEYIQRWSVWLDIYILLMTVKVVIFREGAY
jgi:Undecaprenyl-phosphate galactose phosphotransferase WbaP